MDSAFRPALRTQGDMFRFFVPLALQSASQSFSFLLVASVVSHGALGSQELAAFSQGQSIMWVLGAVGQGLITTCMVFGRSRTGMANFLRLNRLIMATALALECVCLLPPMDKIVFGGFLGLSGAKQTIAWRTLLYCLPLQSLFFFRNPYLAQLLVEKRSGAANLATLARIALALAIAPLAVRFGCTGHAWGAVAITLPVALEAELTRRFARAGIRALVDAPGAERAPVREQLRFTLPLSVGGVMLAATGLGTAYFLGHAADAVSALPVHYVAVGLVNPVSFAAFRMQSVTIAFPPAEIGRRAPGFFALWMGAALSLLLLIPQVPALARWYFGGVQNLPPEWIGLARAALLVGTPIPLLSALRGHGEGLAALRRRPNAIFADQAAYSAVYVGTIALVTHAGLLPGGIAGVCGTVLAVAAAFVAVSLALVANDYEDHFRTGRIGHPVR